MRAEHESQLLPPALNQLALVKLMQSGAYDRHLRVSRQRYRARRNLLVDALRRHLPGYPVRGAEAGVQLLLELPPGTDVTAILNAAARRGIELCNLYEMQLQSEPLDPGLLVGYGSIKDTAIDGPSPRWPASSALPDQLAEHPRCKVIVLLQTLAAASAELAVRRIARSWSPFVYCRRPRAPVPSSRAALPRSR